MKRRVIRNAPFGHDFKNSGQTGFTEGHRKPWTKREIRERRLRVMGVCYWFEMVKAILIKGQRSRDPKGKTERDCAYLRGGILSGDLQMGQPWGRRVWGMFGNIQKTLWSEPRREEKGANSKGRGTSHSALGTTMRASVNHVAVRPKPGCVCVSKKKKKEYQLIWLTLPIGNKNISLVAGQQGQGIWLKKDLEDPKIVSGYCNTMVTPYCGLRMIETTLISCLCVWLDPRMYGCI